MVKIQNVPIKKVIKVIPLPQKNPPCVRLFRATEKGLQWSLILTRKVSSLLATIYHSSLVRNRCIIGLMSECNLIFICSVHVKLQNQLFNLISVLIQLIFYICNTVFAWKLRRYYTERIACILYMHLGACRFFQAPNYINALQKAKSES